MSKARPHVAGLETVLESLGQVDTPMRNIQGLCRLLIRVGKSNNAMRVTEDACDLLSEEYSVLDVMTPEAQREFVKKVLLYVKVAA